MQAAVLLLVVVTACGRLGFEPVGGELGDGPAASGDAALDDATTVDAPAIDAAITACTAPIQIQVNVPITVDTCAGADLVDGCGPPNTREVVFELMVPATAGYTARAYNAGTQNVSNSTAILTGGCTQAMACAGVLGRGFTAGQTIYFVVEASSGTCASIDFLVSQP